MTQTSSEQVIKERRNSLVVDKENIWKLLDDSYAGGQQYLKGGYLIQYIRESNDAYKKRNERSVYFNHVQPLVDLLIGFIFTNPPNREGISNLDYIIKNATGTQDMNSFMYNVATQSIMMTTVVLVDSPKFDAEKIKTRRDREDNNLNPYCVMYKPNKIRDFSIDEVGNINWLLLDNTYIDDDDPYTKAKEVKVYRLWTRKYYQDFKENDGEMKAGAKIEHHLGEVPAIFVNWRDKDQEKIADTIFEDIALYDKAIYNFMSCLDEMITAGTFKMLFFPVDDPETDIPAEIKSGGVSDLSVIPFNGEHGAPFFAGAGLQEVTPFISAIEMYLEEIVKKIGVESAETQSIVKTGTARKYDFEKTKAYIVSGIKQLEETEKSIYRFARKWEGKNEITNSNIIYYKDFLQEDLDAKIARYMQLLFMPYASLKKSLHKLIVKSTLSTEIKKDELTEILNDIDENSEDSFKTQLDNAMTKLKERARSSENNNRQKEKEDVNTIDDQSTEPADFV